jgi:hypothetical protein
LSLNFDAIDSFFREYLAKSTGIASRETKRRREKAKGSKPFEAGRDPVTAAASIGNVIADFRWEENLSRASIFAQWEELLPGESGQASTPESFADGVLVVRCRSTAWATQLRLLESKILEQLRQSVPSLDIHSIKFVGPNAPSWKKGPRSVPGRGPRDTYG